MPAERLIRLRSAVRDELTRRILPFWLTHTVDRSNGGFVGQVSEDNVPDPSAPKGSILHSRILWTFAAAYRALGDEEYLKAASHAALFLRRRFVDERYGGVYWMLDARGKVLDDRKHVYAQAFAIYALAEYHLATGSDRELQCAIDLFELIDRSAHDTEHGGYEEAFARNWTLLEDVRLSDKDAHERKSMNTHLHVLEAFTNLYRAWPDRRLRERLYELVAVFLTRIINEKESTLIQFFDSDWTPKSSATSFGHDIEHGGYEEAFARNWTLLEDVRLSDKDAHERKSMNTHLHVLEAFTNLYRAWPDRRLRERLYELVAVFLTRIINEKESTLIQFFDSDWTPKSSATSFGHDIEASWLLLEAAEVLSDDALSERVRTASLMIARRVMQRALDADGGLVYESRDGRITDADKYWWPQAEAVVGFVTAFQISGDEAFFHAAERVWEFTDRHIVDHVHGEWHERVDRQGAAYVSDKTGPWKCPYHNGRMCLEVMRRTAEVRSVQAQASSR